MNPAKTRALCLSPRGFYDGIIQVKTVQVEAMFNHRPSQSKIMYVNWPGFALVSRCF